MFFIIDGSTFTISLNNFTSFNFYLIFYLSSPGDFRLVLKVPFSGRYIYMCMYMYMYVYVCICIYVYIYVCVYVCVCIYVCICIVFWRQLEVLLLTLVQCSSRSVRGLCLTISNLRCILFPPSNTYM